MRYKTKLCDQPTEYLEHLIENIEAELAYRKAYAKPIPAHRELSRCSCCGHTGHNVMTCGGRGFPYLGKPCDCGRSDCPTPTIGEAHE